MNSVKKYFRVAWEDWCKFWFTPVDLFPLSVLRILLGSIFFVFVLSRSSDLALFFSNSGFLPAPYASLVEYLNYHKSIFYYYDNLAFLKSLHVLLLISLFTFTIGFCTRLSSFAVFFLNLMFINRNPATQFGVDFIGSFYFFYMMFAKGGAHLSVDAIIASRHFKNKERLERWRASDLLSPVMIRLMQIQLCVIYFYSGISKLKGTRWWNGSAIWDVFTMEGLIRYDMSFLAYIPDFLVVSCYLVLLWEIYFPVLIWLKPLRNFLILFGIFMHLGFWVFLQIPTFGALMCSLYVLFLDPNFVRKIVADIISRGRTYSVINRA